MKSTWLVIKHEVLSILGRPSFWLMTFVFPLFVVGVQVVSQVLARSVVESESANLPSSGAIGYVDEADLIQALPSEVPPGLLVAYSDQDAARAALESGQIDNYYLIPADFVAEGEIVLVSRNFNALTGFLSSDLIRSIVSTNLVGDEALARRIVSPTGAVETVSLGPQGGTDTDMDNPLTFIVPYAALFILFFAIMMSSSYMLQSVAKEKENRVIEVLLVSLRPREMMLGKVVGLGVVALVQMGLWVGAGLFALERGSDAVSAIAFELPPGFVFWMFGYFVLGYLLYASLMGALGALAPSMREGQQLVFLIILPLLAPLWLMNTFIMAPNGALPTFLSLFPLTAPVSMVARMVATSVPVWQPILSLALLAVTTYFVVVATARLFRVQTLLSGASLSYQRIWKALREQ